MNKYSKKILNFIINNTSNNNNYNIKSKIIDDISTICKNVLNLDFEIKYTVYNIKKIHEDDYPLLYKFITLYYKKYNITNFDPENFVDFLKFYSNNQHKIFLDKMISKCKKDFSDTELDIQIKNIIDNIYEVRNNRYELHKNLYDNNFVGLDILQELETSDIGYIDISYDDCNLKLYYPLKYYTDKQIKEKIYNIIRIVLIMKQIHQLIDSNKITFNIYIYLSKLRKSFPTNNDYFTPLNMNSGSTMKGIILSVWREEELEKVLIHELCHYINADFYYQDDGYSELDDSLKEIFDIKGHNNPNESYNETLAGIINICLQAVKYKYDVSDIFFYELEFLYIQVAKIILFLKGNKYEQLFKSTENHLIIQQNTSTVSYIILKMILFHNINKTLEFISECKIKCNNSEEINAFNRFLIKIISDKKSQDEISGKIDYWIKILSKRKRDFIMDTFRMSAISD